MKTIQFSVILACWSIFNVTQMYEHASPSSLQPETKIIMMNEKFCRIDNQYDSLVKQGIDNVLQYKELNTPSGNKGLIIWKDKSCVYGLKFLENTVGGCSVEMIESTNENLGLIALQFFYEGEKNYTVTKSKIEFMHDYIIHIRALVNGKEMKSEFLHSSARNKTDFLPEIARLCQNIIYKW